MTAIENKGMVAIPEKIARDTETTPVTPKPDQQFSQVLLVVAMGHGYIIGNDCKGS